MTLPEVFDFFNDQNNDRSWWPLPSNSDESIPLLTAAVRLSGRMDDCRTSNDLREAVEHAMALVSANILDTLTWARDSALVEAEMEAWAEAADAHLQRIAESN